MVKRQRRMTKKKPAAKNVRAKAASRSKRTKVKATTGAKRPIGAKTDRATKATNKLLKSIQKKRSQQ